MEATSVHKFDLPLSPFSVVVTKSKKMAKMVNFILITMTIFAPVFPNAPG